MIMTYSHAKVKVNSQSVPKIEWKQTDRRTDGGDRITSLADAVGKNVKALTLVVNGVRLLCYDC